MGGKAPIDAAEMVRRIRDDLARQLADKSAAEVIAFYRNSGKAATRTAPSRREAASGTRRPTRGKT